MNRAMNIIKMKEVLLDLKAKLSIRVNKVWDLTESGSKNIDRVGKRGEKWKEEGERDCELRGRCFCGEWV